MNTNQDRQKTGISLLEVIFGIVILMLVGIFFVVFVGRKGNDHGSDPTADQDATVASASKLGKNAPRQRDAAGHRPIGTGKAGADGLADTPSVLSGSEGEAQEAQAEHRVSASKMASAEALRSYFSSALDGPELPRWQSFLALARTLDLEQLPAAWSLLQEQPWSREKQDAMKAFVMHWTREAPESAIEFALGLESSRQRRTAYATALETWAATDPEGALAWYDGHKDGGKMEHRSVSHLLAGLYTSAPETALAMIWETEDPRKKASLLRSLFLSSREDREQGAMELKALFDASEDPSQRQLIANMVAGVWAADDPMRVIAWGSGFQDDPELQTQIYKAAIKGWGRREPEATMEWMQEQGLLETFPDELRHITRSWGYDNPTSLQRWIESAPPSSTRDTVVTARIDALRRRDPTSAMALAEIISVSEERYKAMASIASSWMRSDKNAATAAILSSSMPTEMKRKYAMKVVPKNTTNR